MDNGDQIICAYDDTLIGQGSGSSDAVLIVMPEVEKPKMGPLNTIVFATLGPGNPTCTTMYADMAAPREIISPLAGGVAINLRFFATDAGDGIYDTAVLIDKVEFQ